MDYEFRRDLHGRYKAELSMGHEALGLWLTEEVATDLVVVGVLLEKIAQLQNRACWEHRHPGREFMLTMTQEGVEVRAALLDDLADEAPEELSHYDEESQASCGLDDFRQLLEAWCEFIKEQRLHR